MNTPNNNRRKESVEKIEKKLDKKPADDVDDIKKSGKKTADLLVKGVEGIKQIEHVANDIRSSAKSGHRLDDWDEKNWLSKEIRRLANEIDRIEREIEQIKAQIRAAREAERAAALTKLKEIF